MQTSRSYAPGEALQKILDGYSKGHYDKLKALKMIADLRSQLSESESAELRTTLTHILRVSDMVSRNEGSYTVNLVTLALSALAEFCPFQQLLELVMSRYPMMGDDQRIEVWTREIVPELRWNLLRVSERVDTHALNCIKAQATLAEKRMEIYSLSAIAALHQLEKTAEFIEFQRFEKTLSEGVASTQKPDKQPPADRGLNPAVANALREANERLQNEGQFDSKIAADLIRSAMEEAHRGFVVELGSRSGAVIFSGADKDGARRLYMRQAGLITLDEETFFSAIYALISREGSHKLIAPRETVLLLYQTVYSYLLLLNERLHKAQP
jgi:hypothetical protein